MATKIATATFTRPGDTTTYASGDAMGAGTATGECVLKFHVGTNISSGKVLSARLIKSTTGATADDFRLTLFQKLPSLDPDDNVNRATPHIALADAKAFVGTVDFETAVVLADGNYYEGQDMVPSTGIPFNVKEGEPYLYGILTAIANYAPGASEVFTIQLEISQP